MTSSASSRQIKQPSILGVCIDKEGRALMTGRTVLDAQSYGAFRVVSTQSTPSPDRLCIWHDAIGLSGPYRARRVQRHRPHNTHSLRGPRLSSIRLQ
jgi:hypothetical protein